MKELSIEGKAKRYDEALKVANKYKDTHIMFPSIKDEMFPELKESEDEVIRKELIAFVKSRLAGFPQCDKYLTWIEKQDKRGSSNTNQECLRGIKRVQEYKELSDWEKKFDNIASMYAHNKNQEGYNNSQYVKERADAMLYHAKKELEKQGEHKPAWSEEDENGLGDTLWAIKQARTIAKDENDMGNLWYAERWLKSLKERVQPQNTWKPNEVDILLLERMANGKSNPQDFQASLYALIGQLKNLRKE